MQNFVIVEGLFWYIWQKPEFFLQGLQAYLGCCAQLNIAGRFCENKSRVPLRHCYGAEFGNYGAGFDIVKLSFSKRVG